MLRVAGTGVHGFLKVASRALDMVPRLFKP